ncbi:Arc family DNA-binding protein [Klebsiella pneumoniae]|uniref:Arc family DNA-binding protein n=1 Tax=Klebsiella pneumoniae TaxID=573 RepID=UPI001FEE22C2|nr:Arc family DNA-binding protein [Klebsiella pneumoniae]
MAEKQVKDYDKFNLRFPDGMRDAIAERAKRNGRSMNSEIVNIIEDALLNDRVTPPDIYAEAKDYFPEEKGEEVMISKKKLNELIERSMEEAIRHFASTFTHNAVDELVQSLSDRYEFKRK